MESDRSGGRLTSDRISQLTFTTSRRGFDPDQVRRVLTELGDELRAAIERGNALQALLDTRDAAPREMPALDEATVTELLGIETTRVLTAAREAASHTRERGQATAAKLIADARAEASRLLESSTSEVAARTAAADAAAARVVDEAERRAAALTAKAESTVAEMLGAAERTQAEAEKTLEGARDAAADLAASALESAREQGRGIVREAELLRDRVLREMAEKRRMSRAQLEQLNAGRERLAEAYDVVRRTLAEATTELDVSIVEAKRAADAAVRRGEAEPIPPMEELVVELEVAREIGYVVVPEATVPFDEVEAVGVADAAAAEVAVAEVEVAEVEAVDEAPGTPSAAAEMPDLPDDISPPPPAPESIAPPRRARRRRGVPELPPTELKVMAPRDPVEAMRVITSETPSVAPIEVAPDEPAPAVVAPIDVVEPNEPDDPEEPAVDVDGLFAQLRAAREGDVERAKEILAEPAAPAPAPEPAPKPPPAVAAAVDLADFGPVQLAVEPEPEPQPEAPAGAPDDEALLERRDGIVEDIDQRVTRRLKRALADEQNEVLDRLRRSRKPTVDALFEQSLDEHRQRWAAAVEAELAEAAKEGAAFYGTDGSAGTVDDLALALAADLVDRLRERVEASLRDAGGDEEAAADGIRAAYREWKRERIPALSHDVVLGAFSRGVYDAAPSAATMRWLVDDGGSPCPDAEDNALAGMTCKGDAFPTGHLCPPAHPGCRCLLVPAAE